jgi:type VI secretion system secreted protein Hcp
MTLLLSARLPVLTANHTIVSPRDPQSGLPTGQRMHKAYTFV